MVNIVRILTNKEEYIRMSQHFSLSKHRSLWMWMSKNPGKYPASWPGWKSMLYPPNYSFACAYASKVGCSRCPFVDEHTAKQLTSRYPDFKVCYHGYYHKWLTCTDLYNDLIPHLKYDLNKDTVSELQRLIKRYAEKISQLKVRKDISIRTK